MRQVASLPRQLRVSHAGGVETESLVLTTKCWSAVCGLEYLGELHFVCTDIERMEQERTFSFKSRNLRQLSGILAAERTEAAERTQIVLQQIIKPVLGSCQQLSSIDLHLKTDLSSELLSQLLSKQSLTDVKLNVDAVSYSFEDLSALPNSLPLLETLKLPWPTSIGFNTNDDDSQTEMCLEPVAAHGICWNNPPPAIDIPHHHSHHHHDSSSHGHQPRHPPPRSCRIPFS